MKKVKTSDISNSAQLPVKQGTLNHLQSSYQEVIAAIMQNIEGGGSLYSNFTILYGCQLTISGGNYTVSEGAICYNGEVFLVDAVGTTANPSGGQTRICRIVTTFLTAANADPVTFTDGNTYNVHEIRKIVIGNGTNATSGYVGDFASAARLCNTAAKQLTVASTGSTYTHTFEVNRTIDYSTVTSGGVVFDFNFDNAAIGATQRMSLQLANADVIALSGASDRTFEICDGAVLTRVNNASPVLKTASGTENVVIEMTYLGFVASAYKVGIKIWS